MVTEHSAKASVPWTMMHVLFIMFQMKTSYDGGKQDKQRKAHALPD